MVIVQVDDIRAARELATAKGVRFADKFDGDGVHFTHLHPKARARGRLDADGKVSVCGTQVELVKI